MKMSKIIDGNFPKNGNIVCHKVSAQYLQEDDNSDNMNELHIETENQGAGDYFIIKTERWLFDDIDEMIRLLTHFKNKKNNAEM